MCKNFLLNYEISHVYVSYSLYPIPCYVEQLNFNSSVFVCMDGFLSLLKSSCELTNTSSMFYIQLNTVDITLLNLLLLVRDWIKYERELINRVCSCTIKGKSEEV